MSLRAALRVALLLGGFGWGATRADAAPAGASVIVTLDPYCDGIHLSLVRRAMAIELDTPVETSEGNDPSVKPTKVVLACRDQRMQIVVDDALTQKKLERSLAWHPGNVHTRSRIIALAASELVLASWAELGVVPPSDTEIPGRDPSKDPTRLRPNAANAAMQKNGAATNGFDARQQLRLTGVVLSRIYAGTGAGWGGGVEVGRDEQFHIGWTVGVQASHATPRVPEGMVAVEIVDASGMIAGHGHVRRVGWRGGVGVRGGGVRFAGNASNPNATIGRVAWGRWFGLFLAGAVDVALHPRLGLHVGIEVGYVTNGATVLSGQREVLALEGAWLGTTLGLTVFP